MDINIIEEKDSPLMHRKQVSGEIDFETNVPSEKEVKDKIAKTKNADAALIVIKKIEPLYGLRKAKVSAFVYDSKENLAAIEREQPGRDLGQTRAAVHARVAL